MRYAKIFRDPIYGYVPILLPELEIIQTKLFQRLRRIRQLHSACFPYYCGTHSRHSHSIGTMHLAGIFADNLLEPYFYEGNKGSYEEKKAQYNKYLLLARLWGLIHDIGHGPYSHAFEYYVLQKHELDHEKLGEKIVKARLERIKKEEQDEFGKAIYHYEQTYGIDEDLILDVFRTQPVCAINGPEYAIHQYLFKGYYNVDVIDYIQRDAYFCGTLEYGKIDWDRLAKTIHLMEDPEDGKLKVVIEERSTHTITSILLSRIQMYSAVYYHKDARSSEKLFKKIMELIDMLGFFNQYLPDSKNWDKRFENFDDNTFMCKLLYSKEEDDWINGKKEILEKARKLAENLRSNRLPSEAIFESRVHEKEQMVKVPTAVQSESRLKKSEDHIRKNIRKFMANLIQKEKIGKDLSSKILSSLKEWYLDSSSFDMSRFRPVRSGQHPFPSNIPVYHRRTKEIIPISKIEPFLRDIAFSYHILRLHVPTEIFGMIKNDSNLCQRIEKIFEEGIFLRN